MTKMKKGMAPEINAKQGRKRLQSQGTTQGDRGDLQEERSDSKMLGDSSRRGKRNKDLNTQN